MLPTKREALNDIDVDVDPLTATAPPDINAALPKNLTKIRHNESACTKQRYTRAKYAHRHVRRILHRQIAAGQRQSSAEGSSTVAAERGGCDVDG